MANMLAIDRLEVTYDEALAFGEVWVDEAVTYKPTSNDVRALQEGLLAFASEPLHVLVPGKNAANALKSLSCHVCSTTLPRGSFVRASDSLLLCSPELSFLQMAASIPFQELVKLGFELCGLYSLQPDGSAGYGRVLPSTTVYALEAYLERCPGMPGLIAARKALRYIAIASGSPMETALAIILCLPLRLGGYGLPLPRMNYRIDDQSNEHTASGKAYYLCDLYWPEAGVCIEYDSDLEHTGSNRIARDAQRRNDLTALGVTTITATREQVMHAEKLDCLAHQVARILGVRMRSDRGWELRVRGKLFRSLIA